MKLKSLVNSYRIYSLRPKYNLTQFEKCKEWQKRWATGRNPSITLFNEMSKGRTTEPRKQRYSAATPFHPGRIIGVTMFPSCDAIVTTTHSNTHFFFQSSSLCITQVIHTCRCIMTWRHVCRRSYSVMRGSAYSLHRRGWETWCYTHDPLQ